MSTTTSMTQGLVMAWMGITEKTVRDFISHTLEPCPGHQIKASELYARIRAEHEGCQISDVKLAELFGAHLQSKRVASGKVWLDYRIKYDLDWAGPKESDVQSRTIYLSVSSQEPKVSLRELGPAIRNLVVKTPVDSLLGVSLYVAHRGQGESHLFERSECPSIAFSMIKGLWITRALYEDVEVSFTFRPSAHTENHQLCLNYEYVDEVPYIYRFTNKVTYAGPNGYFVQYDVYSSGTCSLSSTDAIMAQGKALDDAYAAMKAAPCPTYSTYPLRSGFRGIEVLDGGAHVKALTALMHPETQMPDYATERCDVTPTLVYTYYDQVVGGYRQCVRFNIPRHGDWMDDPILCTSRIYGGIGIGGTIIFRSYLGSSTNPTRHCNHDPKMVLNVVAAVDIGYVIEYETAFTVPYVPAVNIFTDCKLQCRYYFLQSELRRQCLTMGRTWPDIDKTLADLRKAMDIDAKASAPKNEICEPSPPSPATP